MIFYHTHADLGRQSQAVAGLNLTPWLLGLVSLLLVCEQCLAFGFSYHPPRSEAGA